jgi:hypothetical protein
MLQIPGEVVNGDRALEMQIRIERLDVVDRRYIAKLSIVPVWFLLHLKKEGIEGDSIREHCLLLLVVYLNDFVGQRLLRHSAPRNDIPFCHCERSEAISAYRSASLTQRIL